MDQPETPLPEALLIRRARMAQGLSPERIVERMQRQKLSGRAWRQYEDGERRTPDHTLAHMAHAVGVAPEQLEDANRDEAAEILREILRQEEGRSSRPYPPDVQRLLDRLETDPDYAQWLADLVETARRGHPPDPPARKDSQNRDTA